MKQGVLESYLIPICSQYYNTMFITAIGTQKYLVEHEGDGSFFEGKCKVDCVCLTIPLSFCEIWLNGEDSFDLKDREETEDLYM